MPTIIREKWSEIKEIFYAASQLEPAERAPFLDESCKGDDALRREVESLLSSSRAAGNFMQDPAIGEVADSISDEIGKFHANKILHHYKILKLLGAGGMGEVYLAEDMRLERKVAIKILPARFAQDPERMRRFVQEAKAVSALNHPNILTIYETGEIEETNYIASEYVEGETVSERLLDEPMNLKAALDVAAQMASALQAAHGAGIIHRDVKPDNVMIRPDGVVKLLDFGIAKLTEVRSGSIGSEAATAIAAHTQTGMIIGTANYMSPEQARGKEVDARTDIFSFGLTLYEMLSGKRAFEGENAMDVIGAILQKEPIQLRHLAPIVPQEIERIVNKALRKDREERYQTAKDLLVDLRNARQDVEFQDKLERTAAPLQGHSDTQIDDSGTRNIPKTASNAESAAAGIKHRNLGFAALGVLLLAAIGFGYWFLFDHSSNSKQIDSIAVMPFVNEGDDANVEYLSDGMTETLISSLSQIPKLNVKSRASVFRYKGKETDAATIGKQLNVQAIVYGTVIQRGQELALHIELVDAETENALWSSDYKQPMANLVSLQSEIARDVSQKLKIKLSGADEKNVEKNYTENAEAYQFYLRGRYFWNKRNEDGIKKAIEEFQQAIEHDPNYALGYVGLADSYIFMVEFADAAASEMVPKARTAIDRALKLDDSLSEAHASSALIYRNQWHWAEAEQEFKRAVSINSNNPTEHIWFSVYFRNKRQFDDALSEIKRAQELDPLSPVVGANVAYAYVLKNDLISAVEQSKKIIELDPSSPLIYELLGIAYLKQKNYQQATVEFEKAVELSKRTDSRYLSSLGYCYGVTGRRADSLAILKELNEKYASNKANGQNLAAVYAGLGDKEQAFIWLERDFDRRSFGLPEITWRFAFDNLRADPRYTDLVGRMGLPQ
ncbi:MAG: protein kinase [Acidobacteriota bacterium]